MKVHTSDFKEQIKRFGRELDSKITYEIGNEEIELGKEELNSISPHYEGAILKSVMKQLDIDSNVEIPIGTILRYQFGVKVDGEYEYIDYGNYVVYSIEKQEDTNSYKIVCYDKMLYAMKEYENSDITFPITIKDYLEAICEKIGLEYEESPFANSEKIISNELFLDSEGRSMNCTFRDVLDQIAEASGGTICINKDDKLEIRYIHDVGEITDVSNSNIEITDGEEAELQTFELEGKTEQKQTTPNKNLLYINSVSSGSGVTITRYSNSEIVITGTSTSSGIITIPLNSQQLSNQPYTFSGIVTGTINKEIYIDLNTANDLGLEIDASGTFTQTSLTETASNIVTEMVLTFNNETTFNNVHIKLQLEQSSTATSYIESQLPMPSPDYPSELNSVGYKNLLKYPYYATLPTTQAGVTWENDNGKIIASGTATGYSGFTLAKDIPVLSNTNYRFYIVGTQTNVSVDISGTGLGINIPTTSLNNSGFVFNTGSATTLTINVKRQNSSSTSANFYPVLVLGNNFSTEYVPYGKYGIEVKTTGKNLFDKTTIIDNMGILYANGNLGSNNNQQASDYIIVEENTEYYCNYTTYTSNYYGMAFYDENKGYISGNSLANIKRKFTTPIGTHYIRFSLSKSSGYTTDLDTLQLEKGTQATEYEPYQSNTQLYVLDEPLRSIGDTKDLLYIRNGTLYVDRKIGKLILKGTENWQVSNTGTPNYIYYAYISNFSPKTTGGYSDYYKFISIGGSDTNQGIFAVPNYVRIRYGAEQSIASFKSWLTTNNVELDYLLTTPYTEEIGEVQMPSVYDGITYIQTTDALKPIMNVSYISEFEEIDEEYLKDVNVNFGEKFGSVNTIVLSRGGDGDKISTSIPANLPDEDKVAIQITDNQIMNGNDRNEYMAGILNRLYGLEYYINDFTSTGICYLDLCDRYRIKIGDTSYKCVMFNDEANITQGLVESIYTDLPKEEQQEYKYMGSTDRGITQANIIAKKNEAEIVEYTQKLDDTNNRINAVETKQTETDRTINIISTNIDANGNITEVTTTTGFTFNAEGMTIEDSGSNFKALHRSDGTYYKEGDETVGQYTKDGSKQKDLSLFGVYYYGMDDIDDTPMFVAQLYHDENGEEAFGHFYNRGD